MAEPKIKPLDIDGILGKPKNRITRMGVELEGAWKSLPQGAVLEPDGSVFRGERPDGYRSGELPIGPMQPGAMPKFMKKYYPHKVDATCGMHVHMSFENLRHYMCLMVPEYQETIIEYLERWAKSEGFKEGHHIWARLAGKSVFCQKKFWPDLQVNFKGKDHDQARPGHRYTIVHYCGRQLTIEIRVLPMMATVDQAIRGIQQVIDITNASLVLLGKEEKIVGKLELPGGDVYEEYLEERL